MSGGMPELGSKISLISKADIRYEGRLFTVDPNECTIALANVRSFGTEDRDTQYPITPQSQVYDYILFRGSDIKDIRVINNVQAVPNDPAIMQMHLPNQMAQPTFQPQSFPMPMMGHVGQMGQFGAPYGGMGGMGGLGGPSGMAPGAGGGNQLATAAGLTSMLELISGGSRSTTPVSLISRKSPTADMGVQVQQNKGPRRSSNQQQHQQNDNRQRERRDSGKLDNQQQHDKRQQGMQQQNQGNQQSRGWQRNSANMRGPPRGRGGPNQGGFRQQNVGNQNKNRPKNTIKFDSDYDFEQANNQFEELRSHMSKLKVGEEAKPEEITAVQPPLQVNGVEAEKKDDSGNETGAGEHEEAEGDDVNVGYDKTKSFFDNISCEAATDRTKGKNRTDWRQERKLNSETFGYSSTRRGGYRGRGGYFNRNMNMGGYHRGGYRPNNYRGRQNNNRNQMNNAGNGLPQKQPQSQTPQPSLQPQPAAVAAVK